MKYTNTDMHEGFQWLGAVVVHARRVGGRNWAVGRAIKGEGSSDQRPVVFHGTDHVPPWVVSKVGGSRIEVGALFGAGGPSSGG